ncbi:EVE domain-containing protein [Candidatus Poribacteria bacterium]|nr:EVE domain-containing protein [Candidatus Poribacteria bacterium]
MKQFWLIVGTEQSWKVALQNNNIWGLKDFRELRSLWNMLREGDGVVFYVSKPVHGIVGFGSVTTKFRQDAPLWPEEIEKNAVVWPLRFEFDVEYCLAPDMWRTHRYTSHDLQMITRMVFQCYPIEEANVARVALDLKPYAPLIKSHAAEETYPLPALATPNHESLKSYLAEIGSIQGYIAQMEYPMESARLDVVWRRIERSVPTYVFEVQIGGDIYHAMAKLKHAFDLWNSHIFLVGTLQDKSKYQELISGTFHEVADRMRFIDVPTVHELLQRKRSYKELETTLGIIPR